MSAEMPKAISADELGDFSTQDGLHLQEVLQAMLAPLAAITGALETPEGRVHVAGGAVDGDSSGPDAPAELVRSLQIT